MLQNILEHLDVVLCGRRAITSVLFVWCEYVCNEFSDGMKPENHVNQSDITYISLNMEIQV